MVLSAVGMPTPMMPRPWPTVNSPPAASSAGAAMTSCTPMKSSAAWAATKTIRLAPMVGLNQGRETLAGCISMMRPVMIMPAMPRVITAISQYMVLSYLLVEF